MAPCHFGNVKADLGAGQVVLLFGLTVMDDHIKTAAQRNDELVLLPEGMTVAPHTAGYIIYPIVAHHLECHIDAALDNSEIASWILDLGQVNQVDNVVLI